MGGGQSPQQRACFSTNASSSTVVESEPNLAEPQREYYVPVRRQYEGAPKRQHGRNHGWRKFSKPKDRPWHVKAEKGVEKRELKEVSATIKGIRVSPWQLNLLARVVRNLPVVDAIAQMEFGKKKHTNTYQKIIKVGGVMSPRCLCSYDVCMFICIWLYSGRVFSVLGISSRSAASPNFPRLILGPNQR